MTSKHHRWQTRWRVDPAARRVVHDTGLIVEFTGPPGSAGRAVNESETVAALAVKNGPGNAPVMLRRLLREAEAIHLQGPRDARL